MPPELTQIPLNVSTKNIIPPVDKVYTGILMEKTCSFIRRMRWRPFHMDHPDEFDDQIDKYGFKSRATPQPNILMAACCRRVRAKSNRGKPAFIALVMRITRSTLSKNFSKS